MSRKRRNLIWIVVIFVVTFVLMGVLLWFFRFPSIKGKSMEPTYQDGDTVIALHVQGVSRGDVAVVWSPQLDEYIVKRVIGLSGDVIEIRDGKLFRNGIALYETYIRDQGWALNLEPVAVKVGEGEMYMLGDNRLESKDSRDFGMFYVKDVFGIVLTR